MKRIIFCMVMAAGIGQVSAQLDDRVKQPAFAVKWSPLHLAHFYPSFQIALEHRIYKNLSIQYDAGLILDYPNVDSEDYTDKSGYRLIGELRYYLPSPPKVPFYIAGEYYFSHVDFDRAKVGGFNCETGECDFYEYMEYKVEHRNQGVGIKFGVLLFPGWNRQRSFFFDINGGFSYRDITYTDVGKHADANIQYYENDDTRWFAPSERNRKDLRLIVGVRLGYRFF